MQNITRPSDPLSDIFEKNYRKPIRRTFWLSLIFLFVLVSGILISGIWLYYGQLEESVPGSGQILPESKVRRVMTPVNGIVSKVFVQEDQKVKKGQVLVELDPQLNSIERGGIEDQITLLQQEANALQHAYANKGSETGSYGRFQSAWLNASQEAFQSQMSSAKMQILKSAHQYKESVEKLNETQIILKSSEELLAKYKALYSEGGIPEKDMKEYEQQVIERRGNFAALQQEVKAREIELDQAEVEPDRIKGTYHKELLDRLIDHQRNIADLQNQVRKTQWSTKHLAIVAPIDGIVNEQVVRGQGETLSGGEVLLSIVPLSSKIEAEVRVTNRDLTYIYVGQPVALRMEALPYQQFGRLFGKVKSISPSSIQDKSGKFFYVIRVIPDKISLKNEIGEVHYLRPGMTVSADFITRKKNIISFIIEPIQYHLDRAFRDPTTR